MAQNNYRNLAGFICGFSSGKLSTVPKWYSVKRKKKFTHKFKLLCLLVFLSWPCAPIKNCWRKKSCWTILPIPPCNLGMICVTPHGNLSISEHSWWKESSNLRKSGLFWNNISNAKKRCFCTDVCPQCFLPWPLSLGCHLTHWQSSSRNECLVQKKWYFGVALSLFWKKALIARSQFIFDNGLEHGQKSQAFKFPICPCFSSLLTYPSPPPTFTGPLDKKGVLLMDMWLFNPQAEARLALEGWIAFSELRISVWCCSSLLVG